MPTLPFGATSLRHLAFLLLCVWLGMVLFVFLQHLSNLLTQHHYAGHPLAIIRFATLYLWLPWFAIAPLVALIAKRFPIRPDRWLGPLFVNAAALLLISLAHGLIAGYVYHYFGYQDADMKTYAPWQHAGHILFGNNMLLFEALAYAVLAASMNVGNFHRLAQHHERAALALRETLAELQLQTLRMQINPHFLFNSLNAVTVLIQKNEPERATEMISRIASFFRRTLEGSGEQWVPLGRELEMAAEYLAIARVRYGERLSVTEVCDQSMRTVPVPAMLLQPLLENAVTHGIAEKTGACGLALRCHSAGERLIIDISDDGAGCHPGDPAQFKEGIGLRNVRLRLQQLYGSDHAFAIESRPGHGTRVTIAVPLIAPATSPLALA